MVTAPLCLTRYGERFYINHLSDILWDGWLYLPVIPCTVSVVCVWSGGRGGCCPGAYFLFLKAADAALIRHQLISMAGVSLYLLKDCEMHFFKLVQYVFTVFCCCCLFLSKNKFNLLVVLLVSPFTFSLRRPLAFLSQCFSEVQVSTWIWRNWTFHTDAECHRKELHVTLYLEAIFKLCTPKLYQCYS